MQEYAIEEYETAYTESPFSEWLLSLKDGVARAKLTARIDRASYGNFGDWKALKDAEGIFEMREHHNPGYRIFYAVLDKKTILLLTGSTKKDQKKTIAKAKEYLADYKRSKNNG